MEVLLEYSSVRRLRLVFYLAEFSLAEFFLADNQ